MRRVSISLPDVLYAELTEVAAATGVRGFGPANWAGELVASELAARRLPYVTPGRCGGRVAVASHGDEPEPFRVLLPESQTQS